jgi:hypothetical protein
MINRGFRKSNAAYLRQGVVITGFDSPMFQDCVKGIQDLHELLCKNLSQSITPVLPIITTYQGYPAIQVDNRFFTSRRLAPNEHPVDMDVAIDPTGALRRIIGDEWVHIEENRVKYFEKRKKLTGTE